MKFAALAAAAAIAGPFYADPDSNAERQARKYEKRGRTADAQLMRRHAAVPQAFWLTSGSAKEVRRQVDDIVDRATNAQAVAVLVAYNIPGRDCAGGARHYGRWIDGFADGINDRPAVVIVEPDALASGCGARKIKRAVKRLHRQPRATVYVDAGHSRWQPVKTMARRLRRVGARGFALNVSNFRATDEIAAYGTELSDRLGGRHFVIDTSRNGQGPYRTRWCNPPGRGLGAPPTTDTGHPLIDAFLWIKIPGESDGQCRNAPKAGRWWPRYALGLARRANPPL